MPVKNVLTGLGLLLVVGMLLSSVIPLSIFAETDVETSPINKANEVVVELEDNFFNPGTITIPTEKATTFVLQNNGVIVHTFTVEELGIDVELEPGEEKSITITPKSPGTYHLICRYHEKEGMVGELILE